MRADPYQSWVSRIRSIFGPAASSITNDGCDADSTAKKNSGPRPDQAVPSFKAFGSNVAVIAACSSVLRAFARAISSVADFFSAANAQLTRQKKTMASFFIAIVFYTIISETQRPLTPPSTARLRHPRPVHLPPPRPVCQELVQRVDVADETHHTFRRERLIRPRARLLRPTCASKQIGPRRPVHPRQFARPATPVLCDSECTESCPQSSRPPQAPTQLLGFAPGAMVVPFWPTPDEPPKSATLARSSIAIPPPHPFLLPLQLPEQMFLSFDASFLPLLLANKMRRIQVG